MKQTEKEKLLQTVWQKIEKREIPINVRTGGNIEAAEWVKKLLDECAEVDEPSGVIDIDGKDKCPVCKHTVGTSGFYCKYCGNQLRAVIY